MEAMTAAALQKPAFRKINWMKRDIDVDRRSDGVIVLKSRVPLQPYARHIPEALARWASERPHHVWLAQRRGAERQWLKVSYGEAKRTVDALTQALLDLAIADERPIAILSGNSIEHALMTQAAMQARIPVAPISPAYSLMSQDHAKLKYIFDLIRPAVVMVQDGPTFDKALAALDLDGVTVIHVQRPPTTVPGRAYADLAATPVTSAVAESIARITPQTVGKLLFTSGSTGMPKAVINTQQMMCANAAMMMQTRPREPGSVESVFLDWMPWNHTMGGNALFNPVLVEGGTLYIDDGRPLPGQFDETLRNLREISPTYYANVPAGYAALASAMEKDEVLCRSFFKNLGLMAYGGARLPDDLYERMQALAVRTTGERIVFYTGWGSTETAPTATGTYWDTERVGLIGLPFPGVELKLVPVGPKYELRLRGVNVTPGYYGRPDLTAAAFDDEGFYCIGDAAVFVDPDDPVQGLIFSGRIVEDFKLTTGTFVQVGALRTDAIAATSPVVQDALVTGQDRDTIGLLIWPNLDACRRLIGDMTATMDAVIAHPAVIERVRQGLQAHNTAVNCVSSLRIARALLMAEPPSIDGNELTDKGYINQRAGLERRAALVERLYANPPAADVLVIT
ncbi:AMP-binding protein [Bradyrhizobium sp. U87765 SZCCT0131]|uniref:AMP-binding protein n=1 Tax=unclassified Bradyrhizobium TaxID=2631580 RepID=UPI001BADE39D|nr:MULTISPECIES: AMP-binding protein [unclassified Bradyrhizobium]MBR1217591.1 AMP-binding protein [Bradyrhizobium sp. U87765 SZCCT0131]MBR1264811.1 AMP-binding protein [Bradyrhizobium sp. U87765 SZCCT0134]MBR1304793.1 AMP-binding protein [Bradyrhizobium sp. U87765 SZCCT0110]MBR1320580.1 AMP-binding protein [Bradyrhizobium sp. U87765 SZCCT0109]MBR1349000.1 AMP-binding protein [Bradyrhizobium sp. U87765 SZCCT0048]